MYKNIQLLDKNLHIDLRFNPAADYGFAAGLSRAPLASSELIAASRHYAIAFPAEGEPVPQAIFSLTSDTNAYVDEDGRWLAPYVPAQVRSYPFVLAKNKDQDTLSLCIDRDAPNFQAAQGDPLFNANGEPTAFLNQTMEFLKTFQDHLHLSRIWGAALVEQDLLTDNPVTIRHGGGKTAVRGLRVVDRSKFKDLDDQIVADWHKRGLLELVYMHLASLDNLSKLLPNQNSETDPYHIIERFQ